MPAVVPGAPNSPGMDTRACYGNSTNPTVYRVTSLADSGSGTLRAAMEATGNRLVIFERSGEIELSSAIAVTSPYLTVAGQTAPSPGITVKWYGFEVTTHDVLIQHVRIRKGNDEGSDYAPCGNTLEFYGNNAYNIVVDHVSTSWGQDENIIVYNPARDANVVIWRSITSEGLYGTSGDPTGPDTSGCGGGPPGFAESGGHGMLVYDSTKGVTIAQSLFFMNHERNPNVQGDSTLVALNNLIFGWQGQEGFLFVNFDHNGAALGGPWKASIVGNRFVVNEVGPEPASYMFAYSGNGGTPSGNEIYRSDNTLANNPGSNTSTEFHGLSYNPNVGSPPTLAPLPVGYTALASTAVEANIVANSGARPIDRDTVDTRIISQLLARVGPTSYVIWVDDVGGFPSLAVNVRPLTTPADMHTVQPSGYTNLELWLHGYAASVEGATEATAGRDSATGTVFAQASMTGATGTTFASVVTEIGGAFRHHTDSTAELLLTNDNALRCNDVGAAARYIWNAHPLSRNFDVDVDLVVKSLIPGNYYSIWARMDPNANTGLLAAYNADLAGTFELLQFNSDTPMSFGTYASTLTVATHHLKWIIREDGQEIVLNDTKILETSDATLMTIGKIGLSVYCTSTADSNTTGIHFKNLVVTDVRSTLRIGPRTGGM